eukprot:c39686_g1_i1 orf=3-410(-)
MNDYRWTLSKLSNVFRDFGIGYHIFVTDRELALMTTLSEIFPQSKSILCRWHTNKNVFAKKRSAFATQEAFLAFNTAWNALIIAPTEALYDARFDELQSMVPTQVMHYLTTTWLVFKEMFVSAFMHWHLSGTHLNF